MIERVLLAGPIEQKLLPYTSMLRRCGYEVRMETTGIGCLTNLRWWRPHVLVMVPDPAWTSGFGILGVMHDEGMFANTPAVLLIEDFLRMRAEVRSEWNCRYLLHPVDQEVLLETIDGLMHQPSFPSR
jgi:hypothetical protein